MNNDLPRSLKYKDFTKVLEHLGYELFQQKPGSARVWVSSTRSPEVFTCHEPHGKDTIRHGTLREYVEWLKIDKHEFVRILQEKPDPLKVGDSADEDRFRRTNLGDGNYISHCMKCHGQICDPSDEDGVKAAEDGHPCYHELVTEPAIASPA